MNSAEKQAVLHCLKSMIDEEVCEECPLYGTTGTDHCEKDCVRLAINALEQEPKMGWWIILKDEYGDITEAVCSCCDKNGNHKWAFCPHCGAKMQEVK